MNILPFCPLPVHHRAFAWTPSDRTDVAETFARFRREHTADDLAPRHAAHAYGDDYDMNERSAHLDLMGEFPK